MTTKLTVYFDGGCPLCLKEIGFYRRRRGSDRIDWLDITTLPGDNAAPDLTKAAAMARFHVREPGGEVRSGARAFAALWAALPGFAPAGRVMGVPGIVHLLEGFYRLFLKVRPLWRPKTCDEDRCALHNP